MTMANRIVVMHRGVIQQVGTPGEVYSQPANIFVATFVGSPPMNLLAGRLETTGGERVFHSALDLALGAHAPAGLPDGPVTVGIRPEHVQLVDPAAGSGFRVQVELVERVGPDSYLLVQLGEERRLTIRVDAATPIREGEGIAIRLPPEHLRLFDAAGNRAIKESS